jgi:PAS domain S-box-containing protein
MNTALLFSDGQINPFVLSGAFAFITILILCIIYVLATIQRRVKKGVEIETKSLFVDKERFRILYENAPVPYVILDKKGVIKTLNKSALRFFGVTAEEAITVNLFTLGAGEDENAMLQLGEYFKVNSPISNKEIRITTKSGDTRWVRLSVFTEGSVDDNYAGVATIFDISDQKKLDQAKTEFVSLASHQMRTPLTTVKWYTEMLLSPDIGELNQGQKDYLKIIGEVNGDMIDLVDTLLNVSRAEIGRLVVEAKPTNVGEVADGILVELSSQVEKKKMNVVKQYDGLLESVKVDPKLLRIVIHNLMTNAIKYTPEGGTVTVAFKEGAEGNQVIVTDTGYGIPENQQNKIFTKLFRADNVKDVSSSQSTGLGLYLIKSIVTAMGGSISFTSKENQGTSFIVTL